MVGLRDISSILAGTDNLYSSGVSKALEHPPSSLVDTAIIAEKVRSCLTPAFWTKPTRPALLSRQSVRHLLWIYSPYAGFSPNLIESLSYEWLHSALPSTPESATQQTHGALHLEQSQQHADVQNKRF